MNIFLALCESWFKKSHLVIFHHHLRDEGIAGSYRNGNDAREYIRLLSSILINIFQHNSPLSSEEGSELRNDLFSPAFPSKFHSHRIVHFMQRRCNHAGSKKEISKFLRKLYKETSIKSIIYVISNFRDTSF